MVCNYRAEVGLMGKKVAGNLLIIGGAEDKKGDCAILKRFVELSGGKAGKLVIVTTATKEPEAVGKEYLQIFGRLGGGQIEILDLPSRMEAKGEKAVNIISEATGIFFTGGDQLRITSILGGTPVNEALARAYKNGVVIAGTSAGASAMSDTMIVEGDSDSAPRKNSLRMAPGLGLLEETVIDQHFAQRGRLGRLLAAVAHNPYVLGIGIDEDTAVVVGADARLDVIGSRTVTIVDGKEATYTNVSELEPDQNLALHGVRLHVIPAGYGFNLRNRQPLI